MDKKLENIRILLEINGGSKSNENATISIIDSIKHLVPNFESKKVKQEDIKDIVEDIQKETILIYDKYFTNDEILQIIEFYKTPIGKIYLSKMGAVTMESMKTASKYGEIIYNRLLEISKKED